jgi:hypothetical protein
LFRIAHLMPQRGLRSGRLVSATLPMSKHGIDNAPVLPRIAPRSKRIGAVLWQ